MVSQINKSDFINADWIFSDPQLLLMSNGVVTKILNLSLKFWCHLRSDEFYIVTDSKRDINTVITINN